MLDFSIASQIHYKLMIEVNSCVKSTSIDLGFLCDFFVFVVKMQVEVQK
jgi:hypothetical protein